MILLQDRHAYDMTVTKQGGRRRDGHVRDGHEKAHVFIGGKFMGVYHRNFKVRYFIRTVSDR